MNFGRCLAGRLYAALPRSRRRTGLGELQLVDCVATRVCWGKDIMTAEEGASRGGDVQVTTTVARKKIMCV